MTDYRPISCAIHDGLEIAAMRQARLKLRWVDETGRTHEGYATPLDTVISDGAEYLLLRGDVTRIRLDRIQWAAIETTGKVLIGY